MTGWGESSLVGARGKPLRQPCTQFRELAKTGPALSGETDGTIMIELIE